MTALPNQPSSRKKHVVNNYWICVIAYDAMVWRKLALVDGRLCHIGDTLLLCQSNLVELSRGNIGANLSSTSLHSKLSSYVRGWKRFNPHLGGCVAQATVLLSLIGIPKPYGGPPVCSIACIALYRSECPL